MAISINKAQAKALADNFFGPDLSQDAVNDQFIRTGFAKDASDKTNYLIPKNSLSTLIEAAGVLVATAQENLIAADRNESGALSESFKILNPEIIRGEVMTIDIESLWYYKLIDGGVKGTKSGFGVYAFKNEKVGKKMMEAIRKWLIREGIKGKTDNKYRGISKREDFRKSITETSSARAYAIARSIKQKGLKQTNFLRNAAEDARQYVKDELGKSLRIDIIRSLPTKI